MFKQLKNKWSLKRITNSLRVKELVISFSFALALFLNSHVGAVSSDVKKQMFLAQVEESREALSLESTTNKQGTNQKNNEIKKEKTKQKSSSQSSPPSSLPKIENLDQLLKRIKEDQIKSRPELRAREARFLKARDRQRSLLLQAEKELRREEGILRKLQVEFEKRDKELSQLEEKLALTMGALGELFGVVKQSSAEAGASFKNSVISAEYPNRQNLTQKISAKKNLPNTADLEKLWFLIQQEMTESGRVTRFEAQVVSSQGKAEPQEVIRVGSFNLVSRGRYLVFDSETEKVLVLSRQPKRRYLSLAKKLEKAFEKKESSKSQKNEREAQVYNFGIDPSRGSLLSLLIQSPNLFERLAQGGSIGYLILILLLGALALCIQKYLNLRRQELLLKLQIQSQEVLENNPLGEVIQTFKKFKNEKQETLELKIEELLLKQTAYIKKGLSTLKLLATTAPLLGLLGTVIGMISTFQSITLFGTGDPKLMAGGISQALVTTALGLIAAIPLIFIHGFLLGKANQLIQIFEEQSLNLLSQK